MIVRISILAESKKLVTFVQLKMSLMRLVENAAFYGAIEESWKRELGNVGSESTQPRKVFDSTPEQVSSLREKLTTKDVVIKTIA